MSGPRPKWPRLKIAVLFSARFSSGLGKKYQQQPVRKLTDRMEILPRFRRLACTELLVAAFTYEKGTPHGRHMACSGTAAQEWVSLEKRR